MKLVAVKGRGLHGRVAAARKRSKPRLKETRGQWETSLLKQEKLEAVVVAGAVANIVAERY